MELLKRTIFALVMLFVVAVIWVGLYIYFESSEVEVDPNAEMYRQQIDDSFNLEELELISERTEETLPVSPSTFLTLVGRD